MSTPEPRPDDNPYSAGCACIEGRYVPIGEAHIPLLDTGFTRSDSTYDVVSVWNGRFFRLDDHLDRFEQSVRLGNFSPPLDRAGVRAALFECVRRAGLREAYVEMIVTRGVPPAGVRDPRQFENRFYAFAIPYVWILRPEHFETGVSMVIARNTRRIAPSSVDPRMKNFHWGDLTRGLFEAYERGASNTILLNDAGEVTEGPGFNLFALCDGELWTPASGVLEGITRRTVIELAERTNLPCQVRMFEAQRLQTAEELFITSTAGGIMPVTRLEGRPVGDGRPGPLTRQINERYWQAHDDPAWSCAVE